MLLLAWSENWGSKMDTSSDRRKVGKWLEDNYHHHAVGITEELDDQKRSDNISTLIEQCAEQTKVNEETVRSVVSMKTFVDENRRVPAKSVNSQEPVVENLPQRSTKMIGV